MKKQIYRIALAAVMVIPSVSLLNSCNDAIDIIQEGELDDAAVFSSVANMKSYLLGIYGRVDTTSEIKLTSVFTDEVGIGPANSGFDYSLHRFILNSGEGYSAAIWANHYITIDRVNRFLRGAALYTPTASELKEYNDALAQARVIRAFAYFQLETYFSTDMKDPNALGVVLNDTVQEIDVKLPRSTNAEIFAFIENDLAFAEANLDPSVPVPNTYPAKYMMVNQNFINAMKARYYLYRGDHPKARQFAQKVITESGLALSQATPVVPTNITANPTTLQWNNNFYGTSTVSSVNPYRMMWADRTQGEVIFGLSRPANGSTGGIATLYTTNSSTTGGAVLFDMGRNLFNILDTTDTKPYVVNGQNGNQPIPVSGDVRRFAFIDPTTTYSKIDKNYETNPGYQLDDVLVIDKYPGKIGTAFVLKNDIKVFRLSEMYFILAECAVAEGNLTQAAEYVNTIRKARYFHTVPVAPNYANATAAYADILKERRVELCFEGHRYVDLKRLGQLANVAIDRHFTDDVISTLPTTIPYDHRFTLPIPLNEIRGNGNIQQNPGY